MSSNRRATCAAAVAAVALSSCCSSSGSSGRMVTAFTPASHRAVRHDPLHVLSNPDKSNFKMDTTATTADSDSKSGGFLSQLSEKIGTVDDDRLIFPELFRQNGSGGGSESDGDDSVTRMFSSLEYSSSEQTDGNVRIQAVRSAGSVGAAAALVSGTMVGAGILALPSATVGVGFLPSTVAMGVAWFYMTMSGLLIAELSLNRLGQSGKPNQGLLDLYGDTLPNKVWASVGSAAYLFLHYAMMVAYIAQGGNNLMCMLDLPPGTGQVLFAATCGTALFAATPAVVETVNSVLVLALAATFAGIIGLGAGTADFGALINLENQHPEQVAGAFPIIFLSLVFQNVVPTVVKQLEGDRNKITLAIVAGTTLPALMFLAWNAVVLGNVPADVAAMGSIDPVSMLQNAGGNIGGLVTAFSSLALITSLIGFTYGLVDALTDIFRLETSTEQERYRLPIFATVFGPPLLLSLANPDIFFQALDYGGAFGVSTLFLVLPPIMVWRQRYGEEQQPLATKPMVPFGKLSLGSMWKAAGTLIVEQGAEKLGFFEFIKEHIHLPNFS